MSDNWTRPPPRPPRPPKAGKRKPSKSVAKLFLLHRDRRVLGSTWRDWIIKPDSIVDPDGNET